MNAHGDRRWLTTTLAIGLTVTTLLLFALVPFVDSMDAGAPAAEDDGPLGILWLFAWLGFPLVGGFIAHRRPRHPIGWILVSETVAIRHAIDGPIPLGGLATWVAHFSAAPSFILVPFLILLFPSGRVESRGWRGLAVAAAVLAVLEVSFLAVMPESHPQGVTLVNPLGIPAQADVLGVLVSTLAIVLVAFGVVVVVHAAVRFRRSQGVERQQFRWFARAAVIFPIGMGLAALLGPVVPAGALDALVAVTFFVSFNGMALAIGIAITRYRLFDIDRVVSRTMSYLLLTGVLVGVYSLGVLGVGSLLPGERSDLLVAASTLAVAALFQPLRTRTQAVVDRRFNRARYDAGRTVETFASRLRDEVDVVALVDDLQRTVRETFAPRRVSTWQRRPG